jgi:hypothetical protein
MTIEDQNYDFGWVKGILSFGNLFGGAQGRRHIFIL